MAIHFRDIHKIAKTTKYIKILKPNFILNMSTNLRLIIHIFTLVTSLISSYHTTRIYSLITRESNLHSHIYLFQFLISHTPTTCNLFSPVIFFHPFRSKRANIQKQQKQLKIFWWNSSYCLNSISG